MNKEEHGQASGIATIIHTERADKIKNWKLLLERIMKVDIEIGREDNTMLEGNIWVK